MKKMLFLVVFSMALLCLCAFSAYAEYTTVTVVADNDYDGNPSWQTAEWEETATVGTYIVKNTAQSYTFKWTPSSNTIESSGITDAKASMVVPGKINNVTVKYLNGVPIAAGVKSTLKKIVFSEGFEKTNGANFNAYSITHVKLPTTMKEIGYNTFLSCQQLVSINLPEGLTTLGTTCFKDCRVLTSITFPTTVTAIPRESFYNCFALQTIIFKGNITAINGNVSTSGTSAYAFYATNALKEVYFLGTTAPAFTTSNRGLYISGADNAGTIYYNSLGTGYTNNAFVNTGFKPDRGTLFRAIDASTMTAIKDSADIRGVTATASDCRVYYDIESVSGVNPDLTDCVNIIGIYDADENLIGVKTVPTVRVGDQTIPTTGTAATAKLFTLDSLGTVKPLLPASIKSIPAV